MRKEEVTAMINKCERCGGDFEANGAWTKYCEACRTRVRAEKSAARAKNSIDGNTVLAAERERLGLSVRHMAEHLGVSEYTYYNAEHYGKAPGTVTQKKMAERLGKTPEQIFGHVLYYRVCRACHNTYQTEEQGGKLCPECLGARNQARERRRRTGMSIQEACRAAKEAGMSYGKYIAAKERGEL